MRRVIHPIAAIGLSLGMAGCIAHGHKDAPSAWPKGIRSTDERQFCGLFENRSTSNAQLHAPNSYQLFDYFADKGRFKGHRGKYVRIRFAPASDTLEVTLLDEGRRKLDFVSLKRDEDYTFSEGAIRLKGGRAESGNVGGGFERFDFKLFVNSSNSLMGKNSTSGAALLFYFLPVAGSRTDWFLWPRISN